MEATRAKMKETRDKMKEKALGEMQLVRMVLQGRARQFLSRHSTTSTAISVLYLVLIFLQIVISEMPGNYEQESLPIFAVIDLVFLAFFAVEYAAHMLVDGIEYFRKSDGSWEKLFLLDASTVLISLVLSTLNAANIIDTRLGILRLFRLLRVPAG